MFSSIKWKFILVYFLLVFIAMVIVGIFIIDKLEQVQIENIDRNMEQYVETLIGSSSYIAKDNWEGYSEEIQNTLNEWRLSNEQTLYVISNEDTPMIIASSSRNYINLINKNALSHIEIDTNLIFKAIDGEKSFSLYRDLNNNNTYRHLSYPVISDTGQVKGILYMSSDLKDIYNTIDESKGILTRATGLALTITIILGFLIASSITVPIRNLTKKAEEMAIGNFNQFVEVKSNDEIGQLANMFNYLTLKLKDTIEEMDIEKSKLNTIFEYMAEGVLAIDKSGKIIHINPIAADLLGIHGNFKQYREELKIDLGELSLDYIDYEKVNTLEGYTNAERGEIVYRIKHAPFKNEGENIGGLIIVIQDITRDHKLENMRKEFVANVSHELKTPITTIKSYAETILENEMEIETQNKFLQVINSECDRMNRLVKDLLQLSNLDYKKTDWKKENINPKELINNIVDKLHFSFVDKGQNLILNIGDNIPNIYVDRDGIEQVITNILSNANKYTEENKDIELSAYSNGRDFIFEVKDEGIGIDKEDQKRIFERFYRVEKGRSRELGGTGLGLSIAREIIKSHKGDIKIYSELNKGTKVIISLPLIV